MSELTRCWLDECSDTAHVVLYATSDRLAGYTTRPRQPVVFCLKHGGEIYDVIRAWRKARILPTQRITAKHSWSVCPNWLVSDLRNDRLPRTSPDPGGWPEASPVATQRYRPQGRKSDR